MNNNSNLSGLEKIRINGNSYTLWINADVVFDSIFQFVKSKFPESIIVPEYNHIDILVLDEALPIEIQSTVVVKTRSTKKDKKVNIHHSIFEQYLLKQVKENVERFGKCWLFIDSQLVNYFKNETSRARRSNFKWLYKYYLDHRVRVFGVDYTGLIQETNPKILIPKEDEITSIQKNKYKIAQKILNDYGYTTREIKRYRKLWNPKETLSFVHWLRDKKQEHRIKSLGYILQSISGGEIYVNALLNREKGKTKNWWYAQRDFSRWLGIIEGGNTPTFVDKFDVAKYFPGYIKNKKFWDEIKNRKFSTSKFKRIVYERGDYGWNN